MSKKRVHFVSLGCPKNLVDTEIMLGSSARKVIPSPKIPKTPIPWS